MRKKMLLIFLIAINIFSFSGCWNYREVNRLAIVGGLAIDKDKATNNYKVTVEIMKPVQGDTGGGKIESDVYEAEGKTIFEAVRNFILRLGRRTYWAHAKVVIIDKGIAEDDIAPVLDWLYRDSELRRDIYVLISKEHTAGELLKTNSGLDDTASFHMFTIIQGQNSTYKYPKTELWQVVENISHKERALLVPVIMVSDAEKRPSEIRGSAIFKDDKVVGYLDEEDTRNCLWINGELKKGLFSVKNIGDTKNDITFEVFTSRTKSTVEFLEENLKLLVDIKADVNIAELSGELNFRDKKVRDKLQKSGEEAIKSSLARTVEKLQKDYKSDVFKFNTTIETKEQKNWKKLKPNWEEEFSSAVVTINVDLHIRGSAVASKPIKESNK
jgi:spore germination protein KC